VSARAEADVPRLLSGVYEGLTLGTPIAVLVENTDARAKDYAAWQGSARAGHADRAWQDRFGHRDPRGGGRASARETVGRVAAGAIAEAFLQAHALAAGRAPLRIIAWVQQMGEVVADAPSPERVQTGGHRLDPQTLTRAEVDASPVRCPDPQASLAMVAALEQARRERDSLGGVIRCVVYDLPAGWGDPVFDKLTGMLAHALASLPAVRGVQFGSGFAAAMMRGSTHNDGFLAGGRTLTNHAGGLLGGITTGMPLVVDVAFKPPATIPQPQQGLDADGQPVALTVGGRHDPCVVPRAVPLVEAAVLAVLADAALRIARLPG